MKRHFLVRAFILFFTFFVVGALAEDKYIVRADPAVIGALVRQYGSLGVRLANALESSGQLAVLNLPSGPLGSAIANWLKQIPGVLAVEPDVPVKLPGQNSNKPSKVPALYGAKSATHAGNAVWGPYVNQPAAGIIGVQGAQKIATGKGALVATIDTGADFNHPALRGALVPGADFTGLGWYGDENVELTQETTPILDQETTPILDGAGTVILNQETTPILDQETTPILDGRIPVALGHGTMVAGLIHLVAPGASIMPVKAFRADGSASLSNVIAGIYFAVSRGADIINMSFSSQLGSEELKKAIAYATANGVICVTSVGNDGQQAMVYPAAYPAVIGVASTSDKDVRSSFSNYGSTVEVAAPGEKVITTYLRNRYAAATGTSFSAPLVAGAAALLVDLDGRLTVAQVVKDLSQAVPLADPGMGAGRLDLVKALNTQLNSR